MLGFNLGEGGGEGVKTKSKCKTEMQTLPPPLGGVSWSVTGKVVKTRAAAYSQVL